MGTGSFPGVKRGRGVTLTPHPFYCRGHERVELYLYTPYGLYGLYRASVPVQGCTLLFYIKLCFDGLFTYYLRLQADPVNWVFVLFATELHCRRFGIGCYLFLQGLCEWGGQVFLRHTVGRKKPALVWTRRQRAHPRHRKKTAFYHKIKNPKMRLGLPTDLSNYKDRYSESNTTCECTILLTRCSLEVTTCFGLLF